MSYLNIENIARSKGDIEYHPLKPFLPKNAKVLFLGSFPPQRKRWCIDFFYPNWINDHWRIEGEVFFGDKTSAASRTTPPTSFSRWWSRPTFPPCSPSCRFAKPSSPRARKPPKPSAPPSASAKCRKSTRMWLSPLPLKGDGGAGAGRGLFFGAFPPPHAPIRSLSRKKPRHTSRCSTPYYAKPLHYPYIVDCCMAMQQLLRRHAAIALSPCSNELSIGCWPTRQP